MSLNESCEETMGSTEYVSCTETELETRFSSERKFRREKPEVKLSYQFTRDPELLQQYYVLRQEMYTKVWNLEDFNGLEDEFDKKSHILVTCDEKQVVAGCRLIVSGPRKRQVLSLEKEGVSLKERFPEMFAKEESFGEVCRTVAMPEYAKYHCTAVMFGHMLRKAKALGLSYIYCLAPTRVVRIYSIESRYLGIDYEVFTDCTVEPSDNSGVQLTLMRWKVEMPTKNFEYNEVDDSELIDNEVKESKELVSH